LNFEKLFLFGDNSVDRLKCSDDNDDAESIEWGGDCTFDRFIKSWLELEAK
jgi:hypothetical protein